MASLLDEATATNRQALGDAATTFGADMQETHAELLQEIRAVEERASKHSQAIAVAAARESAEVQDALLQEMETGAADATQRREALAKALRQEASEAADSAGVALSEASETVAAGASAALQEESARVDGLLSEEVTRADAALAEAERRLTEAAEQQAAELSDTHQQDVTRIETDAGALTQRVAKGEKGVAEQRRELQREIAEGCGAVSARVAEVGAEGLARDDATQARLVQLESNVTGKLMGE